MGESLLNTARRAWGCRNLKFQVVATADVDLVVGPDQSNSVQNKAIGAMLSAFRFPTLFSS